MLALVEAVRTSDLSRFGISVKGGELDGTTGIGPAHPSVLVDESPLGFWPGTLRDHVWKPLGIAVDIQWLMMGALVGLVLGGSQALARSLFAYMTPESRSAEFFGFFGFVGRASAVFGPTLYLLVTGIYDTRAAILAILIIIAVGTVLLQRVDTEEGRAVAAEEDRLAFEGSDCDSHSCGTSSSLRSFSNLLIDGVITSMKCLSVPARVSALASSSAPTGYATASLSSLFFRSVPCSSSLS